LLGAAALLSAAAAAREVVYNPSYCAQFYPNANCLQSLSRRLPAA